MKKKKHYETDPSSARFDVSEFEAKVIRDIVDRILPMAKRARVSADRLDWEMDITACHANGCQLDLNKLLAFDDLNFAHDVFGIRSHIDRRTGKIMDFFSPRCSI